MSSNEHDEKKILDDENDADEVNDVQHLQTITDYKNYAKGTMDFACLLSTGNQLRFAISNDATNRDVVIGLLCLSLVLQVTSSILLFVEHMMTDTDNYSKRKKLNIIIGAMMIIITVIHVINTSLSGPEDN